MTLSSIGLIGLIETLPVQKAPIAYEAIATKIFSQTNSARLLLTKNSAQASFLSLKLVVGLLSIVCATIAGGYYIYRNTKENPTPLTKVADDLEVGTNQIWDFINPQDRKLNIVKGSWKWNETKGLMAASEEEPLVISLPIKPQKKPFMMEFEGIYFATLETKYLGVFLRFGWIKNNVLLKVENRSSPNNGFQFNLNKPIKIKVFFYQNYICTFMPDNSYHLEKCDGDFNDAFVGILSKNLMFKKITSKTFNETPNELLNAIKSQPKTPGDVSESWDLSKPLSIDQRGNKIP